MRATKFQHGHQQPAQQCSDQPLAQSVFNGDARLRELEHLAETARKVRDQAAAELTRTGGTHHIARDRIAAAERMLAKAKKEMAELRTKMGPVQPPPKPQQAPKQSADFELAVLLGHSKASFNRDQTAATTLEMQPAQPRPKSKSSTATTRADRRKLSKSTARYSAQPSAAWRAMAFGLFIVLGVGLGATATFFMLTSNSVPEAAEKVREGASQAVAKIKTVVPDDILEVATSVTTATVSMPKTAETTAVEDVDPTPAAVTPAPKTGLIDPSWSRSLEAQEKRVRQDAEQRLKEQLAVLESTPPAQSELAAERYSQSSAVTPSEVAPAPAAVVDLH